MATRTLDVETHAMIEDEFELEDEDDFLAQPPHGT